MKLSKEVVDSLTEAEALARKEHAGMWRYGDAGDEEDEDDTPKRKPAWGGRR